MCSNSSISSEHSQLLEASISENNLDIARDIHAEFTNTPLDQRGSGQAEINLKVYLFTGESVSDKDILFLSVIQHPSLGSI